MKRIKDNERVYLMQMKGTKIYKIGASVNPKRRMKTFQTANPVKLELVSSIAGYLARERRIQDKFREQWIRGEWFNLARQPDVERKLLHIFSEKIPPPLPLWSMDDGGITCQRITVWNDYSNDVYGIVYLDKSVSGTAPFWAELIERYGDRIGISTFSIAGARIYLHRDTKHKIDVLYDDGCPNSYAIHGSLYLESEDLPPGYVMCDPPGEYEMYTGDSRWWLSENFNESSPVKIDP